MNHIIQAFPPKKTIFNLPKGISANRFPKSLSFMHHKMRNVQKGTFYCFSVLLCYISLSKSLFTKYQFIKG